MLNQSHKHKPSEPLIFYTASMDEALEPGTVNGPTLLDYYIIEHCLEGGGTLTVNGRSFSISAGDTYFLLPGERIIYTADPVTSRRGVWCIIDGSAVSRAAADAGIDGSNPLLDRSFSELARECLTLLYSSKNESDTGAVYRRLGLVYRLLGELSRGTGKDTETSVLAVERARIYIKTNYYKPLSVEDIAREAGLERCYFSTVFKEKTGTSPHRYLTKTRIKRAAELIDDGYRVGECAELVGIPEENFARAFKSVMGMSPGKYKRDRSK